MLQFIWSFACFDLAIRFRYPPSLPTPHVPNHTDLIATHKHMRSLKRRPGAFLSVACKE